MMHLQGTGGPVRSAFAGACGRDLERSPSTTCVRYSTSSPLCDDVPQEPQAGGDRPRSPARCANPTAPRRNPVVTMRPRSSSNIRGAGSRAPSGAACPCAGRACRRPRSTAPRRRPRSRSAGILAASACWVTSPCSSFSFDSMSSRVILRSGTTTGLVLMLRCSSGCGAPGATGPTRRAKASSTSTMTTTK